MKIERLTQVVTFRVSRQMLSEIDKQSKKLERKRADTVRRIFLKGWQKDRGEGK